MPGWTKWLLFGALLASTAIAAETVVQPTTTAGTQPATQPPPKPTKVSIDLDNVTAADAITKLAQVTGLPMKWARNRTNKRFSLHATDEPLLDVIADICTQGGCLPITNQGQGGLIFDGPDGPLAVSHPSDMTLLLLHSARWESRIDASGRGAITQSCIMQMNLIPDPAAQISAMRTLDIDQVRAEDGTIYPNKDNNSWYQPSLHLDAIYAWGLEAQFSSPAPLGKKAAIFGFVRAFVLQDFAQLTIDDPKTPDKSFGNDELKCTVVKPAKNDSNIHLLLEGSLIKAYGDERLPDLLRGGTVTAMDENDQPVLLRVNANSQNQGVSVALRPTTRTPWRENGPATVMIRLPKAAHQIELPVEMTDLIVP